MTAIYCVKCCEATATKSEKKTVTKNGRNRLAGICTVCGTKKGMFVGKDGKIVKSPEELEEARFKRTSASLRKKAEKIGWQVLKYPDAKKCINDCLAQAKAREQ